MADHISKKGWGSHYQKTIFKASPKFTKTSLSTIYQNNESTHDQVSLSKQNFFQHNTMLFHNTRQTISQQCTGSTTTNKHSLNAALYHNQLAQVQLERYIHIIYMCFEQDYLPMGIHNSIAIVYKQMILQAGFLTGQSQHDKYPKLQCVGHCSRYLPVALDVFRVGGTTVVG